MSKKTFLVFAGFLFFFALAFAADHAPTQRVPVVVELFTSEGCSSCPPADKLLSELRERGIDGAQVLLLGEHVDYWNQLGWKDRFSSSAFSDRQSSFANRLHLVSPYTPQMVIDGNSDVLGNDTDRVRLTIARAARQPKPLRVELQWNADKTLAVHVSGQHSGSVPVMMAITEDALVTNVGRGENGGKTLRHTAVVRRMQKIGTYTNSNFQTSLPVVPPNDWKPDQLRVVVWVEDGQGVLGASDIPVANAGH